MKYLDLDHLNEFLDNLKLHFCEKYIWDIDSFTNISNATVGQNVTQYLSYANAVNLATAINNKKTINITNASAVGNITPSTVWETENQNEYSFGLVITSEQNGVFICEHLALTANKNDSTVVVSQNARATFQ